MKKILITGSLGYIGSTLVDYLLNMGYDVTGVDNGVFENCVLNNINNNHKVIFKNVSEINYLDLKNIDVLIHLSGLQNDPLNQTYPGKLYDIEYQYSIEIAKKCKELSIKFIYASSCSVYGLSNSENLLNENSITNPITPYSSNKLKTEKALINISDDNFKPLILRFATLFGFSNRMRFDLYINMFVGMSISTNMIKLNSDGSAWRPNVHINDVCKVISLSIEKDFEKLEIINVGNNNLNKSVKDVVKIIGSYNNNLQTEFIDDNDKLFGDQYVVGKKDKRSYKVDFTKLNSVFGDNICDTTIEKGIEDMILKFNCLENFKVLFNDSKFYRLQWMKLKMQNSTLDSNLNYKR
tara:strand:+ start:58 stop:1113 length:1056 start_codon:yes stop_codon:yes gene_type:complete